jgi:hypothetical protein
MKIALLFLTYGTPMHSKVFERKGYVNNCKILVHPKYPENLLGIWKTFQTKSLIETNWADESIVSASLLMLEEALLERSVEWFILCSEDSYPLVSYSELEDDLKTKQYSMFHTLPGMPNKTSQWWCLKRSDVDIIFKKLTRTLFQKIAKQAQKKSAVDEIFFLTLLKTIIPKYRFIDKQTHYVKWPTKWASKHPTIFNRITPFDEEVISKNNAYFIRKTLSTFKPNPIKISSSAIILTIGSENIDSINSHASLISKIAKKRDVYLLVMLDGISQIDKQIIDHCIQIYFVIWKTIDSAYSNIKEFINQYNTIDLFYEHDSLMRFEEPIISKKQSNWAKPRPDTPIPINITKKRRSRCPKGTRRNKKTFECIKVV